MDQEEFFCNPAKIIRFTREAALMWVSMFCLTMKLVVLLARNAFVICIGAKAMQHTLG